MKKQCLAAALLGFAATFSLSNAASAEGYPNRMRFRRIERPSLMEMDHGVDQDDDPGMFRFTITFAEQSNGKTVLMMRQLASSTEQRDGMIGFGAVEYGYQTLDKLAAYVGALKR